MAKPYTKPVITFQSLSASAPLSSSCSASASHEQFACPIVIPEWDNETVFTEEIGCDWTSDDVNICYHVPMASSNVFDS